MVQLSVCIEMFWQDVPYEERIARVGALGYRAFEFWGWRNKDLAKIKAAAATSNLAVAALSIQPGGLLRRAHEAELVRGMKETAAVARELGCRTVIATTGDTFDDESYEISRRRLVRQTAAVVRVAEDNGLTLVIEPLNTLVDHHGHWLTKMAQAVDIVEEIGSPAAKILDDIYHQQIMEGNIIPNLTAYIGHIGHFHAAGHPGRHELVGGELDYRAVFKAIDAAGYRGYVGLEYSPLLDTSESLKQALGLAQGV